MKPQVCMIVAASPDGVIGLNNALPWSVPEDLQYFKTLTMGYPVVMGRKTFESIGRPLPGRPNYVLSRSDTPIPGVQLLDQVKVPVGHSKVFIIGGSEVYKAYAHLIDVIYLTEIKLKVEGDAHLPFVISKPDWSLESAHYRQAASGIGLCFQTWIRTKE